MKLFPIVNEYDIMNKWLVKTTLVFFSSHCLSSRAESIS